MSEMNIGGLLVTVGVIVFVAAAGPIFFSVLGIVSSVVIINYGLQKMGKPPLFVLLQNFLDSISR
jgi:hypothetical protein